MSDNTWTEDLLSNIKIENDIQIKEEFEYEDVSLTSEPDSSSQENEIYFPENGATGEKTSKRKKDSEYESSNNSSGSQTRAPTKSNGTAISSKPRKAPRQNKQKVFSQKKRKKDSNQNYECDTFAKNVVAKLKQMDKNQEIIAENILHQALFKGLCGQLTIASQVV